MSNDRIYTGIGSRKTPPHVLVQMGYIGEELAKLGWTLRSGAAEGADEAFERGCDLVRGSKEIYLPWHKFRSHPSPLCNPSEKARTVGALHHPAWFRLNDSVKKLMARNMHQLMGVNMDLPSALVICWTPDGAVTGAETSPVTGGTGMAIRGASAFDIRVINLAKYGHLKLIEELIAELKAPKEIPQLT